MKPSVDRARTVRPPSRLPSRRALPYLQVYSAPGRYTGRIAFIVGMLAVVLMLLAALAASTQALEHAADSRTIAAMGAAHSSNDVMRPTIHLEARSLAMFGDDEGHCS